ncbi:MAG: hypothetical protein PHC80_04660, partial [Eubacteriales bacterium]|nr:hypothetical protein [Eubacteriales bacterium]
MLSTKRFLSILLALLLLFCAAPFSARAKSYQDAHPGTSVDSDGFLSSLECEQFTLSTDRNSYANSRWHLGQRYYLSAPYLNKLLYIGNYAEQCGAIRYTETASEGSCFGMAATMALNRMTKTGKIPEALRLYIDEFYEDAENYIDLPIPANVEIVRDLINYYQVAQYIDVVWDNTISAERSASGFDRRELADVVNAVKEDIDADRPCIFSIRSMYSGHAIQCVDYYEYSDAGGSYILLKLYDGNRGGEGDTPTDWFSWIWLERLSDDAYAPVEQDAGEQIFYHQFDGDSYPLNAIRYRDVVEMNKTLNIHNPKKKTFTATNAFLTIRDINNSFSQYAIKPVKSFTGSDLFGGAAYASHYGVFATFENQQLPQPVDATNVSLLFPYMNEDELQYEAMGYTPLFTPTDVRVSLLPSGAEGTFTAFDVVCSSGKMNVSMSKTADASGAGQYADVAGDALRLARFQPDGTLRYLKAAEGQEATDVSLYFGAKDMSGTLDMLKLNMDRLGFLKLYSGADSPAYDGSVVLHADSLTSAMDFTFYKGVSISDTIPFRAATANETWIKIKAQPAGDKVNVTVWTDSDPASDGVPLPDGTNGAPVSKPPVFTT